MEDNLLILFALGIFMYFAVFGAFAFHFAKTPGLLIVLITILIGGIACVLTK